VIAILLSVKLASKALGVWPVASAFRVPRRERAYLTLLMSTGLTFGSIAALYGLTHGYIDQSQYSELVTVVLLSAFAPTLVAQQFFQPAVMDDRAARSRGATARVRGLDAEPVVQSGATDGLDGLGRRFRDAERPPGSVRVLPAPDEHADALEREPGDMGEVQLDLPRVRPFDRRNHPADRDVHVLVGIQKRPLDDQADRVVPGGA
jgi:hypothetical protein